MMWPFDIFWNDRIIFFLTIGSKRLALIPNDMLMLIGIHNDHTSIRFLQDTSGIREEGILFAFVVKEIYTTMFSKHVGSFTPNEIERWKYNALAYTNAGDPYAYGRAFDELLQQKYPGYVPNNLNYPADERNKDVQ